MGSKIAVNTQNTQKPVKEASLKKQQHVEGPQDDLRSLLDMAKLLNMVDSFHVLDNAAGNKVPRSSGDSAEFPTADSLKLTFERVRKVGEFINATLNECGVWAEGLLAEAPNPFYSQIGANGGLAMEMSYGGPSKFWTPLGAKPIAGSTSYRSEQMDRAMSIIKARLGLQEILPHETNEMGSFGPVYQITKDLDGRALPPVQLKSRGDYVPYETAEAMAQELGFK